MHVGNRRIWLTFLVAALATSACGTTESGSTSSVDSAVVAKRWGPLPPRLREDVLATQSEGTTSNKQLPKNSLKASEESSAASQTVKGVVYEVWVYDGYLEYTRGIGRWIREVHVPDLGLSFNTSSGLHVFRPETHRYARDEEPAQTNEFDASDLRAIAAQLSESDTLDEAERTELMNKLLEQAERHLNAQKWKPARRLDDCSISADHARLLTEFLDTQSQAASIVELYLE